MVFTKFQPSLFSKLTNFRGPRLARPLYFVQGAEERLLTFCYIKIDG